MILYVMAEFHENTINRYTVIINAQYAESPWESSYNWGADRVRGDTSTNDNKLIVLWEATLLVHQL